MQVAILTHRVNNKHEVNVSLHILHFSTILPSTFMGKKVTLENDGHINLSWVYLNFPPIYKEESQNREIRENIF